MTIPLEFTGGYDAVQRNFDKIAQLALDAGDEFAGIRFGSTTATYTNGVTAVEFVAHGLGTTPAAVFMTPAFVSGTGYFTAAVNAVDATNFSWGGVQHIAQAFDGDVTHYWLVIG